MCNLCNLPWIFAEMVSLDYEVMLYSTILVWDILHTGLCGHNNMGFSACLREACEGEGYLRHDKDSYKWCLRASTEGTRKKSDRHFTIFSEDNATSISLDADIPLEIPLCAVNLTSVIYYMDFYAVLGRSLFPKTLNIHTQTSCGKNPPFS